MKRSKYIIALLVIVFNVHMIYAQELIDKVVAQVGSEHVLLSDVEGQFSYLQESNPNATEADKCKILQDLLAQKIMVDQARIDSIEVSSEEIDQQVDFRIQKTLAQMNGDVKFFEEFYGKSVAQMSASMRDGIEEMILAQKMQASLFQGINITPSETKAFFNSIHKDSLPYFNAEVEIAELVLVPEVNEAEKNKKYELAKEVYKQLIEEKADFATLVKQHSADPGSRRTGGDLGWQTRGVFVPEFDAVAYTLTKGEISEPFETPFGYHIVQLLERRGNTVHTRHILFQPELSLDDLENTRKNLAEIKAEVEVDSISFDKAIKKYGYKKVESYNNNGRLTNPRDQTTFFETSLLPPDIYFEIEAMDVGQISEPIEYETPRGEKQFRLIKLLSRTRPHRASLKQDYAKIQFFAKENKKNEFYSKWVQEKAANKYVRLEGAYKTCPNLQNWGKQNKATN